MSEEKEHTYTTEEEVRDAFWDTHSHLKSIHEEHVKNGTDTQNKYPCDIRCEFVDFVEHLSRGDMISEELRMEVTL